MHAKNADLRVFTKTYFSVLFVDKYGHMMQIRIPIRVRILSMFGLYNTSAAFPELYLAFFEANFNSHKFYGLWWSRERNLLEKSSPAVWIVCR